VIELAPFPDVEVLMKALLDDLAETGTRTPEDLGPDVPPYIRAVRSGGGDDGITDSPIVALTTYAPSRHVSWQLNRQAQQRVLAAPATKVDGVLIDAASTYTGPIESPDQNPDERVVTTYLVVEYRRPRS
jgi:hypothetical protein